MGGAGLVDVELVAGGRLGGGINKFGAVVWGSWPSMVFLSHALLFNKVT